MRMMVAGMALVLGGCSAAVREGPELAMPPTLQGELKVERVVATGKWSVVRPAFPQGFGDALELGMQNCAGGGTRPVQLRLHVDRNHGSELLRGRIEIVDLRTRAVLGRFPVAATGPGTTRRFVGEICRKGFGREWG
ncbi:hypothetical protein OF829_03045 [Sphingomonas sp. LB-2]|uniref:hypothetical protein n=1 Tax=Sphingomonas caeni TaxID=2984949 RepID=UPI002230AF43|nr:hypothetical protein [Sphingomonas caeni]MCW3846200.1 hypothetical protein [Sphingomonas caeni]